MLAPLYHSHEGHDEEPSTMDTIVNLYANLQPTSTQPIFCPMDLCDDGSSRDPRDCSCPNERGLDLFEQPVLEESKRQEELRKEEEEKQKRLEAFRKAHTRRRVITNSKGQSHVVFEFIP